MPQGTYSISVQLGGISVAKPITRTADHVNVYEVTLPVGEAGQLTTRTNASVGVATVTGHSLANTDTVDIYWSSANVRYGMTVANATANTFEISGGAGDDLPVVNTNVVATEAVQINANIDGDEAALIVLSAESTNTSASQICNLDFQDSGNTQVVAIELTANAPRVWDIEGGDTNDFSGNTITKCLASNGGTADAITLKIASLEDSTP